MVDKMRDHRLKALPTYNWGFSSKRRLRLDSDEGTRNTDGHPVKNSSTSDLSSAAAQPLETSLIVAVLICVAEQSHYKSLLIAPSYTPRGGP